MTDPMETSASVRTKRLSSRYLWASLLVAIVPLLCFAALYDAYFSQLVTRLTQEQLATRMAAAQNEFRVYLRERQYELEALADQFDNPEIFTPQGHALIAEDLEDLLRLQLDYRTLHGIAFFDANKQLIWTFPHTAMNHLKGATQADINTPISDQVHLSGPTEHSWQRPPVLTLRMPVHSSTTHGTAAPAYIGLILRFNALTATLEGVQQGGIYKPLLQVPDGRRFDIVGQPADNTDANFQHPLLGGWSLHLVQNHALVAHPSENMRHWLILMVLGTATGLLLLNIYLSDRLDKQVDTLVTSVEQVASGDLDTPVPPVTTVEMERLTLAIERMRQQLKQMIHANLEIERLASLGQVAAGLAHDIRNPLTTIRTTIQALARRETRDEHRDMLLMVEEEIDRVNAVIENLLNYTRPQPPRAEHIQVQALFNSLAALVNAVAQRQGLTLSIDSPGALAIWADNGQIRQILMNLILNAIQAMATQGSQIRLHARRAGTQIRLAVQDDGPGIPQAQLQRVSEPFFTTKPAGTGLGLAICQTLASRNNGTFTIHSEAEQGTECVLYLPASTPAELPDE